MEALKSVFISYSSKDIKYIGKLTRMLDKMGISYWIAPDQIPAGSNYAREIPNAIKNCEVFLLVLSKSSQESIWVEKELDSAIYYRKKVIPFQIDSAPLNDLFRFYLSTVQIIACDRGAQMAIDTLKNYLCQYIPRENTKSAEMSVEKKPEEKKIVQEKPAEEKHSASLRKEAVQARDSKQQSQEEAITKLQRKRSNLLNQNQTPVVCEYCGGDLKAISRGVYLCKQCGKESYDSYQKIRRYLEKYGAATASTIARETGVSRGVIEQYLRDEYLEIPKLSLERLSCSNCGAPIRTGTLCEICKKLLKRERVEVTGKWRSTRR